MPLVGSSTPILAILFCLLYLPRTEPFFPLWYYSTAQGRTGYGIFNTIGELKENLKKLRNNLYNNYNKKEAKSL